MDKDSLAAAPPQRLFLALHGASISLGLGFASRAPARAWHRASPQGQRALSLSSTAHVR